MYAMIRHYEFDPKDGDMIDRVAVEKFLPALKRTKGFVRYDWINNGNGEGASFSVFQDKETAEASLRIAENFTALYLSGVRITSPAVIGGNLVVHTLSGPTAVVGGISGPKSA